MTVCGQKCISSPVVFLNDVSLKYAAIRGIICSTSKNLTGGVSVERYPITEKDKELIEIGLQVLSNNFDDGIYNHTRKLFDFVFYRTL